MNHTKIAKETINRIYFLGSERYPSTKRKWTKKVKSGTLKDKKGKVDIRINKRVIRQIRECESFSRNDVLDIFQDQNSNSATSGRSDPSVHP